MIIRIWAFLTRGKLVRLKDFDGDVSMSIARKAASGDLFAERWWPHNIKEVRLLPDGTVDGSYVKAWEEAWSLNKSTIIAALVTLTRRLSYFLPRVHTVGGDEFEAVCERCRESYRKWGHCEIPYPVGDMRRQVWIDEMISIDPNLAEDNDTEWGEGYEH